ncbi:hypothetical protein [Nostoc sp.]
MILKRVERLCSARCDACGGRSHRVPARRQQLQKPNLVVWPRLTAAMLLV